MKTWLRYSLSLAAAVSVCTAALLVLRADGREKSAVKCQDISIAIDGEEKFVTDNDVRKYIASEYGGFKGESLGSIGLHRIEAILDSKSAVLKSEVWSTDDGILHVHLSQRKPVVRFQKESYGFYVDERGYIFPLHPSYTAPVPLVKGNIPVNAGAGYKGPATTAREREWICSVIGLVDYLDGRSEWRGKFNSISVRSNGDLVLKQEEGGESFIFGYPDDYRHKLGRISTYYSEIASVKGEGYYKSVNVKYNGQIVCRR